MREVKSAKELGKALKSGDQYILVKGERLCKSVTKIQTLKPWLWGIVFGAIGATIALALATPAATAGTAGVGGAVTFTGSIAATSTTATIMGIAATKVAIGAAIASGGTAVLVSLRKKYKVKERGEGQLILEKKEENEH